MVEEINGTTTTAYHFHYDGNGNVTEITDFSGNSAASYRYDAFGNTLVSTGSYATQNCYRFSTKPLDVGVTNALLYYYGYRYYCPVGGRWPSRDPIEERGGLNLYLYVTNSPILKYDRLGLLPVGEGFDPDSGLPLDPFGRPILPPSYPSPVDMVELNKWKKCCSKSDCLQNCGIMAAIVVTWGCDWLPDQRSKSLCKTAVIIAGALCAKACKNCPNP